MIDCLLSHSDKTECVGQVGESAKPSRSGEFSTKEGRDLEIEFLLPSADNSPQLRCGMKGVKSVTVYPICSVGVLT